MTNSVTQTMTEDEMRAWFERIISHFVKLSETQKQLDMLQQRFTELNERTTSLVSANEALRRDFYVVANERDKFKHEAEENKALAEGYYQDYEREKTGHSEARQSISQLQARVSELESANHNLTQYGENLNSRVEHLGERLRTQYEVSEKYERERDEANTKLAEATAKLARLQEVFGSLFAVPAKVEENRQADIQPFPPIQSIAG